MGKLFALILVEFLLLHIILCRRVMEAILSVIGVAFDHLETALHKFDDGPFFLDQFSLVGILIVHVKDLP